MRRSVESDGLTMERTPDIKHMRHSTQTRHAMARVSERRMKMKDRKDNEKSPLCERLSISDAKTCPFCGCKPTLSFRVVGEGHDGGFVVGCETYDYHESTFCRGSAIGFSVLYKTEADAIKAWNKRA